MLDDHPWCAVNQLRASRAVLRFSEHVQFRLVQACTTLTHSVLFDWFHASAAWTDRDCPEPSAKIV